MGIKHQKGETKMMSAVLDGAVFPEPQGTTRTRDCKSKSGSFTVKLLIEKFEIYAKTSNSQFSGISKSND